MRGWWRALLPLLIAALVALGAPTALAIGTPRTALPLPGSQFQGGDGNQDDAPGLIDWQGLQAGGRVGHTSDYNPSDSVFAGGSEEGDPDGWGITTATGGASPGSDNVLDFYSAVDRAPDGDVFVYLAFTRYAATGGTTYLAFDLNQDARLWRNSQGADIPCRKTDDILIAFQTTGGVSSVEVQRWVTASGADAVDPSTGCARRGSLVSAGNVTSEQVQAAVNTTSIANYLPGYSGATIPEGRFGEAAINLSKVLPDLHERCAEFVSAWMHSRASDSPTSALKDYVAPHRLPVATCKRDPQLSTTASGSLTRRAQLGPRARRHRAVGEEISDTAHLSGGLFPTGTLTFHLYGPDDPTCSGTPVFTFTSTVDDNGYYQSGAFTPTRAGTYRWVVRYSGDVNNEPAGPTACGEPTETVDVSRASPTLSSTASGPVQLERIRGAPASHRLRTARVHVTRATEPIYDVGHLSGGFAPTGTITFRLYGPDDSTCSGEPVFTSDRTVSGNGDYTSDGFVPTTAGTYRWVVHYSGDDNNDSAGPTICGIDSETVVVNRARPTIATDATGAVEVGNPISDTAFLSGGVHPSGTISFHVYGPGDPTCTGAPAHTSTVDVHGNATYHSSPFTPTHPGTYRWVAHYSGDHNNEPASTSCSDPSEEVVVSDVPLAETMLTTTASPGAPAGAPIYDTAHLSGGSAPTGTITFRLYGPANPTCIEPPAAILTADVTGNGDIRSPTFRPVEAGEYRWVATYSGDAHNRGAGPTACDEPAEKVEVSPAQPALTTRASPTASVGLGVHDTAFLTGGAMPTGRITFRLYGPSDATCSGPAVFTTTRNVIGNGAYRSSTFIPRQAGTYRWVAEYSGDDNNTAASTTCGESGETVVVPRRLPLLTTSASLPATVLPNARVPRAGGVEIYDTARLRLGFAPTGGITFALFGPDNPTCAGTPIFTSSTAVSGNGIYNSDEFTVTQAGLYRWVATYSGDANNRPVRTPCGARNEQVSVTIPIIGHLTQLTTSASAAVDLGGAIHDTAHLSNGESPTGTITFRLYGAGDTDCSGAPVFATTVSVVGNGDYVSGSFTPSVPGVYRWVAEYSGDHVNGPAGPTPCGDGTELGIVRLPGIIPVTPALATTASQYPVSGETLYDIAHLTGGIDPGGAITFTLYGPDDQSCSGSPAFTSVVRVTGNGDYRSATFIVPRPGTYRWVVFYSGDAMNTPVGPTACGETTETSSVDAAPQPTPDPGPNAPAPPKPRPKPRPKPKPPAFTG